MDELCSILNKFLIDNDGSSNDFMKSTETIASSTNSDIGAPTNHIQLEMRRSNSSGCFKTHPTSIVTTKTIPEIPYNHVIGPDDDTDSCDEEMFTERHSRMRTQGSVKRLRYSSGSGESVHKRQVINCSYNPNYTTPPSYIDKEFKCIRITSEEARHIVIATETIDKQSPCSMYVISGILPNCEAEKYGKICVGDCIVKINGKRARGMPLEDIQKILYSSGGLLELVLSRYPLRKEGPPVSLQQITRQHSSLPSGLSDPVRPVKSVPNISPTKPSPAPPTGMKKFVQPRRRSIPVEAIRTNRR